MDFSTVMATSLSPGEFLGVFTMIPLPSDFFTIASVTNFTPTPFLAAMAFTDAIPPFAKDAMHAAAILILVPEFATSIFAAFIVHSRVNRQLTL